VLLTICCTLPAVYMHKDLQPRLSTLSSCSSSVELPEISKSCRAPDPKIPPESARPKKPTSLLVQKMSEILTPMPILKARKKYTGFPPLQDRAFIIFSGIFAALFALWEQQPHHHLAWSSGIAQMTTCLLVCMCLLELPTYIAKKGTHQATKSRC
jgi:hypothetical protein